MLDHFCGCPKCQGLAGALCWIGPGVPGRASPGALWPWLFSSVLHSVWASLGAQRGLRGNQAGGPGSPQAALSFHGNSREEPGNTSSGRKATAARREQRASLAEQAPDTLSVQLSGTASLPGLLLCPWLRPHASQSGLRQPQGRNLCSDLGAPGLGDTGVVPWFPGDSWWDRDGLSVCPAWGAVY